MMLHTADRLGPYEIAAPLGAGGMGEVYRARDTRLGRDVAIKVLPVEYAADPDRLRRFGSDPGAAGRVVRLNKQLCTILGVMPAGFRGIAPSETPDHWIPMRVWTQITGEEQSDRGSRWLELAGRLRPESGLAQAQAEMETIGRRLAAAYPDSNRETSVPVMTEAESGPSRARIMGASYRSWRAWCW